MCFEKWNSPLFPLSFFKTEKIKFISDKEILQQKELKKNSEKYAALAYRQAGLPIGRQKHK